MAARITSADWWLRNRATGERTIGQWPNTPMRIVLAALPVSVNAPVPEVRRAARAVAIVALAWWAQAEIRTGVNPFRRVLGVLGAIADVGLIVTTVARERRGSVDAGALRP